VAADGTMLLTAVMPQQAHDSTGSRQAPPVAFQHCTKRLSEHAAIAATTHRAARTCPECQVVQQQAQTRYNWLPLNASRSIVSLQDNRSTSTAMPVTTVPAVTHLPAVPGSPAAAAPPVGPQGPGPAAASSPPAQSRGSRDATAPAEGSTVGQELCLEEHADG
jgi:hypothetical protein